MPYSITTKDGLTINNIPDDVAPDAPELKQRVAAMRGQTTAPLPETSAEPDKESGREKFVQGAKDLAGGLVRGAGSIGSTLVEMTPVATVNRMLNGKSFLDSRAERAQGIDDGLTEMIGSNPENMTYKAGKVGSEIAGTSGVGGILAAPLKQVAAHFPQLAEALAPIIESITTGGMKAGTAEQGLSGATVNAAERIAGGMINGAGTAGMVNPEDAKSGAVIGGAIPVVGSTIGRVGDAVGSVVRPFLKSGQERIAGDALRKFSTKPDTVSNLGAAREVIEGSLPTTAMASGDPGLAGLSRTMQSVSPQYAAELAARDLAQNSARTAALEAISGNAGKLDIARSARDAATSQMREKALDAAGQLQADPILSRIDSMIRNPNNAGKISKQALSGVRSQIEEATQNGVIDARALYAIRKDINDVLSGKLQGETGNLKYASSQLISVKDLIDNAIEQSVRAVKPSSATAIVAKGNDVAFPGQISSSAGPAPSWKQYLEEYAKQSVPINQMELLDDVIKKIQTGKADKNGNLILSAAKLNTLMKNEGQDLMKKLSPEQIDTIRRLAADLNASDLASTSGKAVGSNTVQNMASAGILDSILGKTIGGSTPVLSTAGRVLQLPYGYADKQIMEKLSNAMVDPAEAYRLMTTSFKPQSAITKEISKIGYRAAPVLSAQQ